MGKVIKRATRLACREYDGITLIVTADDPMIHKLNETGTFIWNALAPDGMQQGAVVDKMEREFECSREELERDVEEFLSQMSSKGLVTYEEAPV